MKNKIFKPLNFYVSKIRRGIIPSRYIFFIYLVITIGFAGLLSLPVMQTGNQNVSFLTALFTSASAFSDTGLVTVPTYETWTVFGQAVIAVLIVMGGLGVFAIKIFIFNYVLRLKSGVSDRELVNTERGTSNFGSLGEVIATSMIFIFSIVIVSGFGLTFYFYLATPTSSYAESIGSIEGSSYAFISSQGNWDLSFRYGFFHTISSLNNAGFDIFGTDSLAPFYENFGLLLFTMLLFIIGGIGYPVIYDVSRHLIRRFKYYRAMFWKHKFLKPQFEALRFSLFTKITTVTYFSVGLIMILATIGIETSSSSTFWTGSSGNTGQSYDYGDIPTKLFNIIFNVTATRSAGFTTINLSHNSEGSVILGAVSMFIGASPSSTGGGIRTTTLAIVVLALWAKFTGRPSVRMFKRKISQETVHMSYIVLSLSMFLVLVVSLISMSSLSVYGGQIRSAGTGGTGEIFNFSHILFEVSSAFGTTGLSAGGITSSLNTVSQLFIIVTMFIGQLGISSTILAWRSKKQKNYDFDYLEEGVSIG